MKIAPTLQRCLPAWIARTQGTASHKAATRELRALLAVARLAIKEDAEDREAFPNITPAPGSLVERKRRALSRLSRASVPRGRRP